MAAPRVSLPSPCRGVSWDSAQHRWRAYVSVCGHRLVLGFFPREEVQKAVVAVAEARKRYGDGWAKSSPAERLAALERERVRRQARYLEDRERRLAVMRAYRENVTVAQSRQMTAYQKAYRAMRKDPAAWEAWKQQRASEKSAKRLRRQEGRRVGRIVRSAEIRARAVGAPVTGDRKAYRRFVLEVRSAERVSCYWCGRLVPKSKRRIDHIIPLDKGGADDVRNLCCACVGCNSQKGAKLPHEFSGQLEMFLAVAGRAQGEFGGC